MRRIIAIAELLAFCVGCSSEFGVYYEDVGVVSYNATTLDVRPCFRIDKQKPTAGDQGRAALIGRWRVRINRDCIMSEKPVRTMNEDHQSTANAQVDMSCDTNIGAHNINSGNIGKSSQWEVDEYEFRGDGSYSMRRVANEGKTVLTGSGEDGHWKYDNGTLRLKVECFFLPGTFPFNEIFGPDRYDMSYQTQWIDCRVKWHSEHAFTLEFADPNKAKVDVGIKGFLGVSSFTEMKGHYDSQGCLYCQGMVHWGVFTSVVCNPMIFKKNEYKEAK